MLHSGGTSAALHDPLIASPLQNVVHGHAGSRRAALGLEIDRGVRLILAERNGGDAYVHGHQVWALGKVVENALLHSLGILDVLMTAGQQNQAGYNPNRPSHPSIIWHAGLRLSLRFRELERIDSRRGLGSRSFLPQRHCRVNPDGVAGRNPDRGRACRK